MEKVYVLSVDGKNVYASTGFMKVCDQAGILVARARRITINNRVVFTDGDGRVKVIDCLNVVGMRNRGSKL